MWVTDNHARGEVIVNRKEGSEAGLFFGVRKNQEWQLTFDGNGAYSCTMLQFHAFPEPMQEGCN